MAGFIYFIGAEQVSAVKIGFTQSHPDSRLRSLQVGCPVPLKLLAFVEGSQEEEHKLHKTFARLRLHGEWFRYEMKLWDFVAYLSGNTAPGQASDRRYFDSAIIDVIPATSTFYPMPADYERAYVECAIDHIFLPPEYP